MSFWTKDWISGGTPASRNRRRERVADAIIDLGKFLITGVVFGVVLQLGEGPIELSAQLFSVVGLGLFGGAAVVWIGVTQLRLLEDE